MVRRFQDDPRGPRVFVLSVAQAMDRATDDNMRVLAPGEFAVVFGAAFQFGTRAAAPSVLRRALLLYELRRAAESRISADSVRALRDSLKATASRPRARKKPAKPAKQGARKRASSKRS